MSQSPNKNVPDHDLVYWGIAIFCIVTGFAAPLGFLMIVYKVLSGDKKKPNAPEKKGAVGARTTSGAATTRSRSKKDPLAHLTKRSKRLTSIGTVLTILFGLTTLFSLSDAFYWLASGDLSWFLQDLAELIPMLCLTGGGLGCLWAGLRKKRQVSRYRNYLAMVGRRTSISISALSSATGLSAAKVREDLENMLEEGLFPAGYLDYGGDVLVLSGEGLRDEPPAPKAAPSSPQEQENAILAEIRMVNDSIANEKLSAQIDRIGVITARILDYQKSHPEKSPQLHSFLSYYLPTTLKILRAYGQLEAQQVSGQNITAAMERIEGMMDKVVEGFEKQLDQLFQGDAMDITTDVEVLERMLAKDGLSGQQGMTLGL